MHVHVRCLNDAHAATCVSRQERMCTCVSDRSWCWRGIAISLVGQHTYERSNTARDVGEDIRMGPSSPVLALVERSDRGDVGGLQLEVEDLEVLLDPCRRRRLGEDDVPAVNVPAQHHLCRRPVETACDRTYR